MRVIETIHPNPQFRTFTCDQIISNVMIYDLSYLHSKDNLSEDTVKLYNQLTDIPLLDKSVIINKYSISLEIEKAFENNEQDWKNIRDAVFYCLANFFKLDLTEIEAAHSIKDDRKKFEEKVVDFYALSEMLSEVTIPHDFATHRAAWRKAIEAQIEAVQEVVDNIKTVGFEGDLIYWKNELEKFDKAFDVLLALKLPQS